MFTGGRVIVKLYYNAYILKIITICITQKEKK